MVKVAKKTITNKDIKIENFEHYLETINEFNEFPDMGGKVLLFRGQKEASWNLLPGLARPDYFRPGIEQIEKKILADFKRRAIPFLPKAFNTKSDWEWLALAQHFKLPTRLLDWTENPLIALFFAFEFPKTEKDEEERAIWIFGASEENDFANSNDSAVNPFLLKKTKVYLPNQITQRITAQSGWFTIHKYLQDKDKFLAFNKNTAYNSRIYRMRLSDNLRDGVLSKLDRFGINSFSIYTDLEGLSSFLSWKHFK